MKIAITGASGFIGKNLVIKHLEMGDEVRVMSRKASNLLNFPKDVEVFNLSLHSQKERLEDFVNGVDVLYHCAAEIKDESKMYEVNVDGTKNLIDAARGKISHWVQLSSTGVYGPIFSGRVNEQTKINPINTYEKSKEHSDRLVIEAGLKKFFSFSILRPSNVFGVNMTNQSLFQLIEAVDKGIFFFIGDRDANANYIPVDNVVHALMILAKDIRAKGNIYNVSDSMSLETFIGLIAKKLNKKKPRLRIPYALMKTLGYVGNFIPGSPLTSGRVDALSNKVLYENNLIIRGLGYKPVTPLEVGIENLVASYIQGK